MPENILIVVIFTIFFTASLTFLVRYLAVRLKIIDQPDKNRKLHKGAVPLLGGIAVFLGFFVGLYLVRQELIQGELNPHHWWGFFIGGLILILGGSLDDKWNIKPSRQIIFPLLASLVVIAGGVSIEKITNPLGGFIFLNHWQFPVDLGVYSFTFSIFSAIVIFIWLMGMMYTTKLLDGVDGLVTSVVSVGALIVFLFTMTTKYFQPDIGLAALILFSASLGFLIFNWYPAKVFLGEGGSLFLGYALGVLAIISGGKIAIALLIMGIPILDVAWTIVRRTRAGHNPFRFADREHLHFRLLELGLSMRQTTMVYIILSTVFGLSALFLQSLGKLVALLLLLIVMISFIAIFHLANKKKNV
jgi:UDP-GlcNAc:undecaprenyl-phosphate GlcNAc-1-phosphate transferase